MTITLQHPDRQPVIPQTLLCNTNILILAIRTGSTGEHGDACLQPARRLCGCRPDAAGLLGTAWPEHSETPPAQQAVER